MSETYTVKDQRRRRWYWINNELLDRYADQIGPLGIAVYNALARRADNDGKCWPSHQDICNLTGIKSDRTVRSYLKKLEEVGLISITHRMSSEGDKDSNLYTLLPLEGGPVRDTGRPVGDTGRVRYELPDRPVTVTDEGRPNEGRPIGRTTTTSKGPVGNTVPPQDRTNRTHDPSSSSPLTWQKLIDQYGIEAVEEAKEAAPPNKRRSVKYVAGILRNWQREGGLPYADDQPDGQPDDPPPMSDADRQRLNELFAALGINRQI